MRHNIQLSQNAVTYVFSTCSLSFSVNERVLFAELLLCYRYWLLCDGDIFNKYCLKSTDGLTTYKNEDCVSCLADGSKLLVQLLSTSLETMQIFVKAPDGENIILEVSQTNESVKTIKCRIQCLKDYPSNEQDLVTYSKILEDKRTLQDYNIQNGATVDLVLRSPSNDESVLPTYVITVFIRPLKSERKVRVNSNASIRELIKTVCQDLNSLESPDNYYMIFDLQEVPMDKTVVAAGLLTLATTNNLPELRIKIVHIMKSSCHVGKHIVLASPEQMIYSDMFDIPIPTTSEKVIPSILKPIIQQIQAHKSVDSCKNIQKYFRFTLIPLPSYTHSIVDSLPTIHLSIPLQPDCFDWKIFLEFLASDLEVDPSDIYVVNALKGSTKLKIKLNSRVASDRVRLRLVHNPFVEVSYII